VFEPSADWRQAAELYEKALALDPDHASANYNYAALLHTVYREYDRAEQLYKRALKVRGLAEMCECCD
jgi:tetratricopeptide (TPR) repeat protein